MMEIKKKSDTERSERTVKRTRRPSSLSTTPSLDSWQSRIVEYAAFGAPIGAGLIRLFASEEIWPQALLLIASPIAVGLSRTWSARREQQAKQRRTTQEGFFPVYAECLQSAIEVTQNAQGLTGEEIRGSQKAILKLICRIVELFLGSQDNLHVNASLMRCEPVEKWSENGHFHDVIFAAPSRALDAYRCVLHLSVWAKAPNDSARICLPVAKQSDILLFGAPRTFVSGVMEYVANTRDAATLSELVARQDDDVRDEIKRYLDQRREFFVSFVSVALRYGEETLGVLNVQSDQTEILGPDRIYGSDLERCLSPLCALLGIMLAQENEGEGAT